ncbi:RHS repeat-associated core domain-containing protein [Cellvibrio mixtus]|uniref:RHS repeat-associated core domain-containing protein n=1 Tax=Cellvibrio mixtus TaxID=39650 RepID=UPI000587DBC6|nr:RHS repeat-associated core domain-containing protein [Cellvibrio mixtus]
MPGASGNYPNWKPGTPTATFLTGTGFTGHDQLDNHNLIHMGGRVYDPNLGRFLSADLLVQSPYNSQSFNRYSYTFNNPGSFVDPDGYSCYYTGYYHRTDDGQKDFFRTTETCNNPNYYNQIAPNNGTENFTIPETRAEFILSTHPTLPFHNQNLPLMPLHTHIQ